MLPNNLVCCITLQILNSTDATGLTLHLTGNIRVICPSGILPNSLGYDSRISFINARLKCRDCKPGYSFSLRKRYNRTVNKFGDE